MGRFENQIAVTGDWMPSNGSPTSIFLSIVAGSLSEPVVEDKNQPLFEGRIESANTDVTEGNIKDDGEFESNGYLENRASSRGNLVERMAARAGFNAPRLNTQSIRPPSAPNTSGGQPPFLMTIPPGLSPTTLLESPVFLHNSQILPSPTTGKFSFAPCGNVGNLDLITDKSQEKSYQDSSAFIFKPIAETLPLSRHHPSNKAYTSNFNPVPIHDNDDMNKPDPVKAECYVKSHIERTSNNGVPDAICHSGSVSESSPSLEEVSENIDQPCEDPSGSPSDDGYCWRKYGQKPVKGSDFPWSYYRCTHENCPAMKKLKNSHDGDVTEIVYNGTHNHPKPLPDHNSVNQHESGVNGDVGWSSMQKSNAAAAALTLSHDATLTAPMQQEYCNGGTGSQPLAQFDLGACLDGSAGYSNDEDDERAARGAMTLGYDGEGDESESKRRRHETPYISEMSVVNRAAIREPRVVVQTLSDVDILDDGYRWRKYGQKVVKGNPNPRSYYKCTSPGCNVRKHVERASHDLKSVITTYEGKHNHDVPAARNSSHVNSGVSNTQQSTVPVSSHIHRPELSHMLANAACFRRPEIGAYGISGRSQMNPSPMYGFGGLNQPQNLSGLPGLGKLPPLHPYSGNLSRPMNSFMLPKAEPELESLTTESPGLLSADGSSLYQQLMNRLPLGPEM